MPSISDQDFVGVIHEAIDSVNRQFGLNISKDPSLPLLGDGSGFDSLSFINFIASVEDSCHHQFGLQLSLTATPGDDPLGERFSSSYALASFLWSRYNQQVQVG
jgi:hypothetical protein